ncbi:hypothetical protein L218DRAFT_953773 [Marasmius fiardii PR-910]|nr:hypothetical protein L218DRAFT_953773 [Marasmius fiardii PR-910]
MTLGTPLEEITYTEELEWITVGTYCRLKEFHDRCRELVGQLDSQLPKKTFVWFQCGSAACKKQQESFYFQCSFELDQCSCTQWWLEFRQEVFEALKRRPCSMTVEDRNLMAKGWIKASGCPQCQARVAEDLREYLEDLAFEVNQVIDTVSAAKTVGMLFPNSVLEGRVEDPILTMKRLDWGSREKDTRLLRSCIREIERFIR